MELRRNKLMLVVVIGLVTLLPILAALQFQWIGQLNDAEVDQLRANLQSSANLYAQALDHEIWPAQFAFRVSFTGSVDQIARELSLNYQYWSARVSRPDLVEDIYWIDYADDEHLRLYKFYPSSGILKHKEWPEDLLDWKRYFIERNRRQLEQYNPQISDDHAIEKLQQLSARLMAEQPAIPIPVSIDTDLASAELLANLNATSSGRAGFTLLTLNKEYLENTFFPELEEEFFAPDDDIDVLIVSKTDPEHIMYMSDPSLDANAFDNPDAETDIGRIRWNKFTSASRLAFGYASLIDRDQHVADSLIAQVQRAWQPAIKDSFLLESVDVPDFPLQAIIRLAQEDDYDGALTAEDLLVALTSLTQTEENNQRSSQQSTPVANTASNEASPENAWTLRIRHKTGSLETSVAANRRRNLVMSFGILLILGIATVLIYSSSRRAQELADRQMGFVTGVSHELRTPLSVIKSAADNLADGVVNNPDRMQKYGELIRKESSRLNEMVEQVLELAGVLSHKQSFAPKPLRVDDLIADALDACNESISEKVFTVDVSVEPDLPMVEADSRALQGAVCNLINNAIKYSNGSQWIGIKAGTGKNSKKNREIQISVSDKGRGIPQEDLPHIFEDFFRGEDVRNAQIKGNGIGLSIVKKTMELHGGRVSVESHVNQGTTFTLHLPAQ